ncbi:chaperone protein dnaJ 1, mitochondrial isoform X2 [Cornus florida]|uniref:chaperone protein dnaJ 1, mitochondrial isoform X2 n=1 Tax=Cornus florida TaxID=4283 RepID=UPI00289E559A|nr:chaperone protein dnaJ 1, mitochondrial isoform X2 [Cornus florida]
MGRFRWLAISSKPLLQNWMCRRHLPSPAALESSFYRAHLDRRISTLYHRTLYSCSFVGRPADIATTGMPQMKCFIHSTGFCYSMERDYYEILGISKDASRDEIKKAFHELAKKYHPDANKNNPSAKRKFQQIREAYETLKDSEKRGKYDWEHSRGPEDVKYATGDAEGFRYAHRTHFSESFHKIFSEIFENETGNFATDIQVELSLSFSEAAEGCTKHMSLVSSVPCDVCHGRGHPLNAKTRICPTCEGVGRVTVPPFTTACHTCKGLGRIVKESCTTCKGLGVVEGMKKVTVQIPAGVDSGDTIRVPKAGNAGGRGIQPGNLYIKLKVAEDPIFAKDGADIYVDSNISFTQAILGGKIEVPTLSGKVQVKIPRGVQPGQVIVLRGKGLPMHGFLKDHGDQHVRFRITFPTTVNERQRAILEEFAKEEISRENTAGNWLYQQLSTG